MRVALTSFRAWQTQRRFANDDPTTAASARQEGMAAVIEHVAASRFAGARVVVWATNHEIAARAEAMVSTALPGSTTLGTALADDFGEDWAPIAIVGWDVAGSAPPGEFLPPRPPGPGAIESALHALGRGPFFVDFAAAGLERFIPAGRVFDVGAPSPDAFAPKNELRALLYLERSPPMQPL
jgi:erythromycin esterase-like protein